MGKFSAEFIRLTEDRKDLNRSREINRVARDTIHPQLFARLLRASTDPSLIALLSPQNLSEINKEIGLEPEDRKKLAAGIFADAAQLALTNIGEYGKINASIITEAIYAGMMTEIIIDQTTGKLILTLPDSEQITNEPNVFLSGRAFQEFLKETDIQKKDINFLRRLGLNAEAISMLEKNDVEQLDNCRISPTVLKRVIEEYPSIVNSQSLSETQLQSLFRFIAAVAADNFGLVISKITGLTKTSRGRSQNVGNMLRALGLNIDASHTHITNIIRQLFYRETLRNLIATGGQTELTESISLIPDPPVQRGRRTTN